MPKLDQPFIDRDIFNNLSFINSSELGLRTEN